MSTPIKAIIGERITPPAFLAVGTDGRLVAGAMGSDQLIVARTTVSLAAGDRVEIDGVGHVTRIDGPAG